MLESGKIPITIGIVGDPEDVITQEHKILIESLFKDLARRYLHSPIYLFSSIANGSARSVANIFLDLKRNYVEYKEKFELIIPLSEDENLLDKNDEEVKRLLKNAKRNFCLCSHDEIETLKFVADSSLIFIALRDGTNTENNPIYDVINYKIYGDVKDIAKSTFEYQGTVFIMPSSLQQILEDQSIKQTLDKIEEINTDSLKISPDDLRLSQVRLTEKQGDLNEPGKSILNIYSILDVLSIHHHKLYNKTVVWLFVAGLFIIASFGIYTNLWLNKITLTIAIGLILSAGVIYYYTMVTKHHTKYIYNRTLAEALRIQFYWNIAGINNKVSDFILRIHRKEFIWVEHILSSVYGITYITRPITSATINELTVNWVKRQADYFESSIFKMTQKMAKYQLISNISFIAAFALLLSIFFLEKTYLINNLMGFLQVIIGTLLGIAALIRGFIQIKGYSQLLNQYELMNVLYQKAETRINQIVSSSHESEDQLEYLKELFFIIGKESLIENGTWYLILKDKEPGIEGI
jgi:hypothetical protein